MYEVSVVNSGYIDDYWQIIFNDGSCIQFGSEEEYIRYCSVADDVNAASESVKRLAASLVASGIIAIGDVVRYEPIVSDKCYVRGI